MEIKQLNSTLVYNPTPSCTCTPTMEPHLTLYQPMMHICVMSSHKPIRIYMEGLILGVNTLYRLQLFPMVGKGLTDTLELRYKGHFPRSPLKQVH